MYEATTFTSHISGIRNYSWNIRRWKNFSIVLFAFANVLLCGVTEATKFNRVKRAPDDIEPNVALEGQCIVVCDADKVAEDPQIRTTSEYPGTRSVSGMWDKVQQSACGGLVNTRRTRNVAFSAKRSMGLATAGTSTNGGRTTTVLFDQILVNVGNAYNTETSTFMVPYDGVYSISFQVFRLYNTKPLTIDLYVNGVSVLRGFADGAIANQNAAHNSGLFHLSARDAVSVQLVDGSLESGWKDSTFSGYLIFEN